MSGRLSREEVKKIAHLSRLDFTETEIDLYLKEMNAILKHFEKLNRLDLTDVSPTSHISWTTPPVHDDVPLPWQGVEEVLQRAPETSDRYFIVPRIVDKKEGSYET